MRHTQRNLLRLFVLASFATASATMSTEAISQVQCETGESPFNTCFGLNALQTNFGTGNSAFGINALRDNGETALMNTAVGWFALAKNSIGEFSTAVGARSLQESTTSWANTAVGADSLGGNLTGDFNVAVGYSALISNTTGRENTAIGVGALAGNGAGFGNTASGASALDGLTGSMNSAHGAYALRGQITFGSTNRGSYNTANGAYALNGISTGNYNTASGFEALGGDNVTVDGNPDGEQVGIDGNRNTASGAYALRNATTANNNTAIGYRALLGGFTGMTGGNNTANGANALLSNTAGGSNTANGYDALRSNTTGARNTANGTNSLRFLTTGFRNTALGASAGKNITTGSDNIIIGADNLGVAAENGVVRIGNKIYQQKTFVAGIRGVQTGLAAATPVFIDANGQLGTIKSSRAVKENIQAMGDTSERLLALRPVTFQYKEADEEGGKPTQFGLIAEEVAEAFPELVIYDEEGKAETVAYHLLATLLLNEFQAQAGRIEVLEAQAAELAQIRQELAKVANLLGKLDRSPMLATSN